jgi:N-acetylornithine carbamoyltransferase
VKHFISMLDGDRSALEDLVQLARRIKAGHAPETDALRRRILVMVFFNPSLRTRTSFETAMLRHGGHAICLSVGGDTWRLEHRDGVVMDGAAAEHVREAAPVLSRYGDVLAVRTFAEMKDPAEDARETVIRSFERHATVAVINMESAVEHPCQGLADWMTIAEKLGQPRGRRFTLSWAPHVKGLPRAVPHSAILAAAAAGMHVTIAHPPGYELDARFIEAAREWCAAAGATFQTTDDQMGACRDADVLYVKSWGRPALYQRDAEQKESFRKHASWTVRRGHLGPRTLLMHCLPVRRNVVIADDALDDPRCIVVDQADNRTWTQAAVLCRLLGSP